jgi:hypothetical protein
MGRGQIFLGFGHFWRWYFIITLLVVKFWSKKVTICPLLKTKVASEKPSNHAGFGTFCPLSHFFS